MKYLDEFRDPRLARGLLAAIRREVQSGTRYRLMEFCGGHTHALHRYGIPDLLPDAIELVHGPGCPVCVLPIGRLDAAIRLALEEPVTLCTYADLMRVPAAGQRSLYTARAQGADVRMITSPLEALSLAREEPRRDIVFLAIGFETTTPPTAAVLLEAASLRLSNFSVLCNHVLTPAAIRALLGQPEGRSSLDGILGPAHVSTVIGSAPYESVVDDFRVPIVISGFEPLDILLSVRLLVRQINEGRAVAENEYTRSVTREGNTKAQAMVAEVFEVCPWFAWRGLGAIPRSGLQVRSRYARFDAFSKYALEVCEVPEPKGCLCGQVLQGRKKPSACKLFGRVCTPETPVGACMVSSEGACAAWYTYGRARDIVVGSSPE